VLRGINETGTAVESPINVPIAPLNPEYSNSSRQKYKLLTEKIISALKKNALLPCFFCCVCWYIYTYPFLFFWKKVLTTNT